MAETKVRTGQISNSSEAWTSWTPTWTNFTIGNGTTYGAYKQIGKTVHYRLRIVLGTTSSMGTTPIFTIPVTANSAYTTSQAMLGFGNLLDVGSTRYVGLVNFNNTTSFFITGLLASGTYLATTGAGITATVPFTWTTTDEIQISGTYEAA